MVETDAKTKCLEPVMKPKETVHRIQKPCADADAFDDVGRCAWDEADSGRTQAKMLESQLPNCGVRGATKLAIGASIVAGLVTYLVNEQDVLRAGIAAFIWLAIGWYSGKVLFSS